MCFGVWFRHLKCSLWVFWGCFNGPRKDKSYAYLPKLAGNQMGQNYDGLFSASEVRMKFYLLCLSMFRTQI